MKVTQTFKFAEDKKHSVIYRPATDTAAEPALASSIYLSRLVLPRPTPQVISISVDFEPTPAVLSQPSPQA